MDEKTKVGLSLLLIVIIAVSLWKLDKDYDIFGGVIGGSGAAEDNCYPLSFDMTSNGTYLPPTDLICQDGAWINTTKLSLDENINETYCQDAWKLIKIEYTSDSAKVTKIEAQGDEYCQDGVIYKAPKTCGNYLCDVNESIETCPIDCDAIQNWITMKTIVESDTSLKPYIANEGIFSYNYPEIEELAKEVEATNPETPFFAVKTLTRIINQKINYVSGGTAGNEQCGENSGTILERGSGNCVDYSVVMIATLRRGFDVEGVGRVQIPARQVAGCLNGFYTWKAVEFSIYIPDRFVGQVIGHSWTSIYIGHRWLYADPTSDVSLIRTMTGYHPIEYSTTNNDQLCYVSRPEDKDFCRYYSTTGQL